MKSPLGFFLAAAIVAAGFGCARVPSNSSAEAASVPTARPNDNRVAAGSMRDGKLRLDLDVVRAGWHPDRDVDTAVTVLAFAERGKSPTIPGPLLRVTQGTVVRATVRNLIPDSTLIVHGLRAGTAPDDTILIAPGATREVVFTARDAGTFLYWGATSWALIRRRAGRDSQLSGAIVVDPAGSTPDPRERVFVISLIDINSDTTAPPPLEEIWEIAVNGRSWPHTERLAYAVGDTVRWRWVNASDRSHPMHLHGFHFRVMSTGTGDADSVYTPEQTRLAVTELVEPGSTFSLEWIPRREGNWLVHCHMIPHIVPFPSRADDARRHDVHDQTRHPFESMAGLVLGVTTTGVDVAPTSREPARSNLRLLVQQRDTGRYMRRGFVLQRGADPRPDSVEVPGSPLVVTRGEKASVTVVNRLSEPTSIHWHGLELQSVFDGVAGYSGIGASRAPLIVPGDSFTVSFTPPRAGTYMYHTHMDEEDQLGAGLYGPIIVLEPGEKYEPETDILFIVGLARTARGRAPALNGTPSPTPRALEAGVTYRLRFINLLLAAPASIRLAAADSSSARWRLVSKDGAAVTGAAMRDARLRMGVGESYDFEWMPPAGDFELYLGPAARAGVPTPPGIRQRIIVRP